MAASRPRHSSSAPWLAAASPRPPTREPCSRLLAVRGRLDPHRCDAAAPERRNALIDESLVDRWRRAVARGSGLGRHTPAAATAANRNLGVRAFPADGNVWRSLARDATFKTARIAQRLALTPRFSAGRTARTIVARTRVSAVRSVRSSWAYTLDSIHRCPFRAVNLDPPRQLEISDPRPPRRNLGTVGVPIRCGTRQRPDAGAGRSRDRDRAARRQPCASASRQSSGVEAPRWNRRNHRSEAPLSPPDAS